MDSTLTPRARRDQVPTVKGRTPYERPAGGKALEPGHHHGVAPTRPHTPGRTASKPSGASESWDDAFDFLQSASTSSLALPVTPPRSSRRSSHDSVSANSSPSDSPTAKGRFFGLDERARLDDRRGPALRQTSTGSTSSSFSTIPTPPPMSGLLLRPLASHKSPMLELNRSQDSFLLPESEDLTLTYRPANARSRSSYSPPSTTQNTPRGVGRPTAAKIEIIERSPRRATRPTTPGASMGSQSETESHLSRGFFDSTSTRRSHETGATSATESWQDGRESFDSRRNSMEEGYATGGEAPRTPKRPSGWAKKLNPTNLFSSGGKKGKRPAEEVKPPPSPTAEDRRASEFVVLGRRSRGVVQRVPGLPVPISQNSTRMSLDNPSQVSLSTNERTPHSSATSRETTSTMEESSSSSVYAGQHGGENGVNKPPLGSRRTSIQFAPPRPPSPPTPVLRPPSRSFLGRHHASASLSSLSLGKLVGVTRGAKWRDNAEESGMTSAEESEFTEAEEQSDTEQARMRRFGGQGAPARDPLARDAAGVTASGIVMHQSPDASTSQLLFASTASAFGLHEARPQWGGLQTPWDAQGSQTSHRRRRNKLTKRRPRNGNESVTPTEEEGVGRPLLQVSSQTSFGSSGGQSGITSLAGSLMTLKTGREHESPLLFGSEEASNRPFRSPSQSIALPSPTLLAATAPPQAELSTPERPSREGSEIEAGWVGVAVPSCPTTPGDVQKQKAAKVTTPSRSPKTLWKSASASSTRGLLGFGSERDRGEKAGASSKPPSTLKTQNSTKRRPLSISNMLSRSTSSNGNARSADSSTAAGSGKEQSVPEKKRSSRSLQKPAGATVPPTPTEELPTRLPQARKLHRHSSSVQNAMLPPSSSSQSSSSNLVSRSRSMNSKTGSSATTAPSQPGRLGIAQIQVPDPRPRPPLTKSITTPSPSRPITPPPKTASAAERPSSFFDDDYLVPGVGLVKRSSLSELRIPSRIMSAQGRIAEDLNRVKDFAKGIDDLKALKRRYTELKRLSTSPKASPTRHSESTLAPKQKSYSVAVARLEIDYRTWWEQAQALIDLGDGKEVGRDGTIKQSPGMASSRRDRCVSLATASPQRAVEADQEEEIVGGPSTTRLLQVERPDFVRRPSASTIEPPPSVEDRYREMFRGVLVASKGASLPSRSSGSPRPTLDSVAGISLAGSRRQSPSVSPTRSKSSIALRSPASLRSREPSPELTRNPKKANPRRASRVGILGLLRTLKVMSLAEQGKGQKQAGLLSPPPSSTPERRVVSDPTAKSSTPQRVQQPIAAQSSNTLMLPPPGRRNSAASVSSSEEDWDRSSTQSAARSVSPEPQRELDIPRTPTRLRTQSTGHGPLASAAMGDKMVLTTQNMPNLLRKLADVKVKCDECLLELQTLAVLGDEKDMKQSP